MATNVCQVVESAGLSGAVDVLDNYSQIAPQERETIANLAVRAACPEQRGNL